jgi:hypothetical protein
MGFNKKGIKYVRNRPLSDVLTCKCKKGHDTTICGRNASGGCRMCAKERHLIRTYGITFAEYEALYNFQKGKCAICGRSLALIRHATTVNQRFNTEGRAEVDHLHILKKQKIKPSKKSTVRGLLCGGRYAGCNHRLGKIDSIPWLTAALAYITNPPAHQLFGKAI